MQSPKDIEQHLNQINARFKDQNPYEIFDLWPGCGRTMVQTRFYELVKIHHPDSYGGNLNAHIRDVAQENFIRVKDAYTLLRSMENEQTAPERPVGDVSSHHSSLGQEDSVVTPVSTSGPTQSVSRPLKSNASTSTPRLSSSQPGLHSTSTPSAASTRTNPSEASSRDRADALARLRTTKRTPSSYGLDMESEPMAVGQQRTRVTPATRDNEVDRKALLEKLANKRKAPPPRRPVERTSHTSVPGEPAPTQAPEPPAETPKSFFAEGYQHFKASRPDLALDPLRRAHEAEPGNAVYMTIYARVLFLTSPEEHPKAEDLLREAIRTKNRQSLPDAHLFLGLLLKTKPKGMAEAIRHFRNAAHLNPSSRDAQREVRLYEMRHGSDDNNEEEGFLKKLFKK